VIVQCAAAMLAHCRQAGSEIMSIFGKIMSAIFGGSSATAAPVPEAAPSAGGTATATMSQVDVEAVLTKMTAANKEKLDWRKSIVDLMKLLGLDSGLGPRKELARELGYKGDMNDSAKMNIWLHKQVMQKLAANGGKVPDDLK
jgi:dihydroorotase-like cyclic amidohydrolase